MAFISTGSSLVRVNLPLSPAPSNDPPANEASSKSFGSPSNCSGACTPLEPLYASADVDDILSAVTGTMTEPSIVARVPPQLNSTTAPALPTGKMSRPILRTSSPSWLNVSLSIPSVPSSAFVTTSPSPTPALEHFIPEASHPVSLTTTPVTALAPLYSPPPLSAPQATVTLLPVSSLTVPPAVVNPFLTTPRDHSYDPPETSTAQLALLYFPVPLTTFAHLP